MNQEIGLPSITPGYIEKKQYLEQYLTEEQLSFLQLTPHNEGWTLRSEWALKHLAHVAANAGVQIHTRTRVLTSYEITNGFMVEYQGAGPNSAGQLECTHLVDDTQFCFSAPGSKQHTTEPIPSIIRPEYGVFTQFFGGTALTRDTEKTPENSTLYHRHEGLSEIWMQEKEWTPQLGWIEFIECTLPTDPTYRTIDAQIIEGRRIAKTIK